MGLRQIPSIKELAENPSLLKKLPASAIAEIIDQLKQLKQRHSGASNVPPTPIEMAIRNPRFRWMDAPHLHYLGAEIAEAVQRSKVDRAASAILVTMPPRHAKTHTCAIWTPFWHLARYPEDSILYISYEHNFAAKWGGHVRRLIEMYGAEYGLQLNPKKMARDDWELMTGGGMKCVGVGGSIAGNPAKLLIFDDLVKDAEEARSDVMREKIWDWWETTALQRIEPDTTAIGIGTRYHEDDIIGRILAASANGTGHHFDHITLPAKAMAADPSKGIPDDPLGREVGEGLWLAHFDQESYYDYREATTSPYVWFSVYQQYPSPPGGNTIDPAWWRFYRVSEIPADFDEELQTWDPALDSSKATDSYWCGGVLARKGALVYVRDLFHKHCGADEVVTQMIRWAWTYPKARTKLIERSLAGPAMAAMLRGKIPGIIPWPPKGKQKGSKEALLNATVPDIRSGNVLLPLNPDGTRPREVQELIEECRQFPRAPHDDYCDMFSQGMDYTMRGVRRAIARAHDEANAIRPVATPEEAHRSFLHSLIRGLGKEKTDHIKKIGEAEDRRGLIQFPIRNGLWGGGRGRTMGGGRGRRMW